MKKLGICITVAMTLLLSGVSEARHHAHHKAKHEKVSYTLQSENSKSVAHITRMGKDVAVVAGNTNEKDIRVTGNGLDAKLGAGVGIIIKNTTDDIVKVFDTGFEIFGKPARPFVKAHN